MRKLLRLSLLSLLAAQPIWANTPLAELRARPAAGETIYFLLPDRFENGSKANDLGGLKGDRHKTGFDPAAKGFYHGGDLKGLKERLDYLQGLGATAIWVAPVFKNKPVQGGPGLESAGYHGYWVTDFTRVDPHFGTNAEFKALVDAAHARGMKVYMDIIANHTADVIQYKGGQYTYRDKANWPYSRKGGLEGAAINPDFGGDENSSAANFARLTDPRSAYEPFVPPAEANVKVPDWLNNSIYYHNRGDSTFRGENSRFGDFAGLDDLFTEHPRVRAGMIEIYANWIKQFGIDGYRIDTAKHVDPGFWQAFIPAMLETAKHAGIPNFAIFGEVAHEGSDPGTIARYTRRDGYPAVLDFAFQSAIRALLGQGKGTAVLADTFDGDVLYQGGEEAALAMPTFLGNHDMGRFSTLIRKDMPGISEAELTSRVELAHVMLLTLRGSPVIYYGDEQGFVGDGHDQDAREDMFASKVVSYNDNKLLGTTATTATANFDQAHPFYKLIATLAKLRKENPALARGKQVTRTYSDDPGLFSVSRFDPVSGTEYFIAFNTSDKSIAAQSVIGSSATTFETLYGHCPAQVSAPGSVTVKLPAFGSMVCRVAPSPENTVR
ncbi:MAG: alpha-amylase family glycosyl hydrolase [Novosphingobium sp.]